VGLLSILRTLADDPQEHLDDHLQIHKKLNGVVDPVADFGADPTGATDSYAAFVAARDAIGEGVCLLLPPGEYALSQPFTFNEQSQSIICLGGSTRYFSQPPLTARAKIVPLTSGWVGGSNRGLIEHTSAATGCMMQGVGLDGSPGGTKFGTNLSGILFSGSSAAQQWTMRDLAIHGFSGAGIRGQAHIMKLESCVMMNNGGWGLDMSELWADSFFFDLYVAYNQLGGVLIGDEDVSGTGGTQLAFVNLRTERNGGTPNMPIDDPAYVTNTDAPGLKIVRGNRLKFTNCKTAGNTGDGFLVDVSGITTGDGSGAVYDVDFVACDVVMDGTGDPLGTLPDRAGIRIKGSAALAAYPRWWTIEACAIYDDNLGSGAHNAPKYGIWLEEARYGKVRPTRVDGSTARYNLVGNLFETVIEDPENDYFMVPRQLTANRPVPGANLGTSNQRLVPWMWDATLQKPIYFDGTNWRDATGTIV